MRPLTPPVARRIGSLAILLIATVMPGDGVSAQAPVGSSAKEEERQKLDEMARIARGFRVAVIDDQGRETPATPAPEPLHRWTDPTRAFSDGSLWAWKFSGRPVAVLGIELYGQWSLEFVSLSTGPLVGDDGHIRWAPAKAGVEFHEVPDAPGPADDQAGRLRQMRDIARRFSASEFWDRRTHELRLLPRPVDRYAAPASGLVDGAMFIYANGTNPELLLLIEAVRQGNAPPKWSYAAAPLAKAELHLKLGPREVWTSPSKIGVVYKPEDTYYNEPIPRRRPGR